MIYGIVFLTDGPAIALQKKSDPVDCCFLHQTNPAIQIYPIPLNQHILEWGLEELDSTSSGFCSAGQAAVSGGERTLDEGERGSPCEGELLNEWREFIWLCLKLEYE